MSAYPRAISRFAEAAMEAPPPAPRGARARTLQPRQRPVIRLWLPLTPLFVLLAPFPIALAPLAYFVPSAFRPLNPFAAVFAIGRVLLSLSGTVVRVEAPNALISLRIF